jgi:hypothetical protein
LRKALFYTLLFGFTVIATSAVAVPVLDKTKYHTWDEVQAYLNDIANDPALADIVELIPLGMSLEGRQLMVLRISKEGIPGKDPDTKPASFIAGAHHAREHVSKEAVLALIDRMINGYGQTDPEGIAITYLVDATTTYLLPWTNPDGGTNQWLQNPEQRKTNNPFDEPQIGAADCEICGDGLFDEDSPDIVTGDVGGTNRDGNRNLLFANNGIIGRHLQYWYAGDERVDEDLSYLVQPGYSEYTFNYEGYDPDADGLHATYSGEDFVGGVDPNRNYGDPVWGECEEGDGCSWLSGDQTFCGLEPFSEPETSAVAAFLQAHPNIVTLESLHSGVNEIYPPWFLYPDDRENTTMDESYHDSVAQYISGQTGYEVIFGGPYAVKGDTTGYSYMGSSQDLELGLTFFPGGILSITTEIYGMGSDSGSAEAVKDWFPHHWEEFDTHYPQGLFLAWYDFPWCTTCNPDEMPGRGLLWNYIQYTEYFQFINPEACSGETDTDIFHCDYWGLSDSPDYYADFDIFAYFNPPAANHCYKDWNCEGDSLVRTVDKQIKHLLHRMYVAPQLTVDTELSAGGAEYLNLAIRNEGFLRTSVMTNAVPDEDPLSERDYEHGLVKVTLMNPQGFSVTGPVEVDLGWLGGARSDDPAPRFKLAAYEVDGLDDGDSFTVVAESDKTGAVSADMLVSCGGVTQCGNGVCELGEDCHTCASDCACTGNDCRQYCEVGSTPSACVFTLAASNHIERNQIVDEYFYGDGGVADGDEDEHTSIIADDVLQGRSRAEIQKDIAEAKQKREEWHRIEGPFDVIPGVVKGITVKKYH